MVTPATHQPKSDRQNGNWKIHKRKRMDEAMIMLIFFRLLRSSGSRSVGPSSSPGGRQWGGAYDQKRRSRAIKLYYCIKNPSATWKGMMIEGSLVYYQSEIEVDSSENFLIALGQEKKAASLDEGLAPHHNQQHCRVFFPMMMMMVAIDILWGTLHLGCHHHAVVYNVRRGPSHWWVWVGYMYSRLSKPSIT